jgi:CubicO group peptidase (beta-lactamase class C family)
MLARLPGVVAMATDAGGTLYEGAAGQRDGKGAPMTADTVFGLASMTKALVSAAALQQVDQGRLSLDRPIAEVLPELSAPQVLTGFAADGTPELRPARGPITLRQLLSHSSGLGYDTWNAEVKRYLKHTGLPRTPENSEQLARMPLLFDPGTNWNYSISTDVVGRAVDAAGGKRLDIALAEGLLAQLGMKETGFVVPDALRPRYATIHQRAADGTLSDKGHFLDRGIQWCMGGGGMHGTAGDYLRFIRMILNGGRYQGQQVLSPAMMAEITRNQLAPGVSVHRMVTANPARSNDAEFFPGITKHWSAAFMINAAPAPTGRGAGGLAWGGIANTYFWIDRAAGLGGVFMAQLLPFADPAALAAFAAFETEVYRRFVRG